MGELAGVSGQGLINEYSPLIDRSSPQRGELQGTDRHARSLAGSQELPVPAGRLERLKTFILSPIRALMAWVKRLLNRTESSGECSITPDAADPKPILSYLGKGSGSPVNRVNYELLVGEGGELNRPLQALALLALIEVEPYSGQAEELLEGVLLEDFTNGIGIKARDWAAGSNQAHDFVGRCDRDMGIHLAHELNCWADSALKLRNAAYAEIKQTLDAVFESGSVLASLYGRLADAFVAGTADTRAVFHELINRKIEGIEENNSIGEWAWSAQSATDWLENVEVDKQFFVARQLKDWTKDATKHLANAEVRASGSDERSA